MLVSDRAAARLAPDRRALHTRRLRAYDHPAFGRGGVKRTDRGQLPSHSRRRVPRPAVGGRLAVRPDRLRKPVAVAVEVGRAAWSGCLRRAASQPKKIATSDA